MDFDTLLKQLPRSSAEDWKRAAERLLRGKPVASIDVALSEELSVSPYVMASEGVEPQAFGSEQGWHILADLRHGASCSPAEVLQALTWGAQGLEFPALQHLPAQPYRDVRFDFLTCVFAKAEDAVAHIAAEQREEAEIWLRWEASASGSTHELLATFPKHRYLLSGGVDHLGLAEFLRKLEDALAVDKSLSHRMAIEVVVPSDYVAALVGITALKLLAANAMAAAGLAEPLPRPKVLAHIEPLGTQSSEDYLIDASARSVAALSAGVDALTIRPYDDSPTEARRVLNMQHVLALEGHFGVHVDAVQGAAFVMQAAETLARNVWDAR